MSQINGDKARFNRERKQKIARRKRTRELLRREAMQSRSVGRPVAARKGSVSA
jgi:hypothetical protein